MGVEESVIHVHACVHSVRFSKRFITQIITLHVCSYFITYNSCVTLFLLMQLWVLYIHKHLVLILKKIMHV